MSMMSSSLSEETTNAFTNCHTPLRHQTIAQKPMSRYSTPPGTPPSPEMPDTPDSSATPGTQIQMKSLSSTGAVMEWLELELGKELDAQVVEQVHRRLLATPGRATHFATLGELRKELLGPSSTLPSTSSSCIAALGPCFASHISMPSQSRLGHTESSSHTTFRDSRLPQPVTAHCTPSGLPGLSLGKLPGRGAEQLAHPQELLGHSLRSSELLHASCGEEASGLEFPMPGFITQPLLSSPERLDTLSSQHKDQRGDSLPDVDRLTASLAAVKYQLLQHEQQEQQPQELHSPDIKTDQSGLKRIPARRLSLGGSELLKTLIPLHPQQIQQQQQQSSPTEGRHPGSMNLLSVSIHPHLHTSSRPETDNQQRPKPPGPAQIAQNFQVHAQLTPIIAPTPSSRPVITKLDFRSIGLSRAIDFGWANGMEGSNDVWYEDVVIHDKLMERSLHGVTTDNQSGRIASTRNSEVVHGTWVPCGRRAAGCNGAPMPIVAKILNLSTMRVCAAVSEVRVMKHLEGCSASVALLKYGLHQGEVVMLLEPCAADLEAWGRKESRTPKQCISMALDSAELVALLHAQGVAHLDIKPRNVLLARDGKLKLADFGDALLLELSSHITSIRGTEGYQCCEMLAASPTATVDACRADVWSLGCLLYELLTGHMLFQRELESLPILNQQLNTTTEQQHNTTNLQDRSSQPLQESPTACTATTSTAAVSASTSATVVVAACAASATAAQPFILDARQQRTLVLAALQQARPSQHGTRGKHQNGRRESRQQVHSHQLQQRLEAQLHSCEAPPSAKSGTLVHMSKLSSSSKVEVPSACDSANSSGGANMLDGVESQLCVRFESAVERERPWWMTHKQLSLLRTSLHAPRSLQPVQAAELISLSSTMQASGQMTLASSVQEPFLLGVLQLLGRVIVPQASRPDAAWVVGQIRNLLQESALEL